MALTEPLALMPFTSMTMSVWNAFVAAGVISFSVVLAKLLSAKQASRKLSKRREQKTKECQLAVVVLQDRLAECKLDENKCTEIVSLCLSDLLQRLQSRELSAIDVLHAFQWKALASHKLTNCLIEPIVEAEKWALECDRGEIRGPLHGLPVSIKDLFQIQGYDVTAGTARAIGKPSTDDAVIVQVLKEQGAIPFVKTNVPQTAYGWETSNPIFGLTVNPYQRSRGVGGSSGGEAALIAAGGSVLGIGNDLGGSLRIPANMCGICSLKPVSELISGLRSYPLMYGQNIMSVSSGPMARDVDSLAIAMNCLLVPRMSELDPTHAPLTFRKQIYEARGKLKIGYYVDDGFFSAVPAQRRAVKEAVRALTDAGHEVVLWQMGDLLKQASSLWVVIVCGDGGAELLQELQNDQTDIAMSDFVLLLKINNWVKKLASIVIGRFMPLMGEFLWNLTGLRSVTGWWNLTKQAKDLRQTVMDDWRHHGFDAVICPGFGCTALNIGSAGKAAGALSYTLVYNLLNFTAGSMPVTHVTPDDVVNIAEYPVNDVWGYVIKRDTPGSEGLPVNVQVVTLPWKTELCLRVMKELEEALN